MEAEASRERIYRRAPNAAAFMARALLRGGRTHHQAPVLNLRWSPVQWSTAQLDAVAAMTGLPPQGSGLLLLPQVLGFRLVMAALTDTEYALPIWRALQVRNRLRLHHAYDPLQAVELQALTGPWRAVAKGLEMDVRLQLGQQGCTVWEGVSSFYYRGARLRGAGAWEPPAAPALPSDVVAQWPAQPAGGWAFAALTGDYNGVHWSHPYARMFGFSQPFHHPARVLGQCLSQWQGVHGVVHGPQSLDAWIRGPVPYGVPLALHAAGAPGQHEGAVLGLCHPGDARAALMAQWWAGTSPLA